jgi:hypothetical protein
MKQGREVQIVIPISRQYLQSNNLTSQIICLKSQFCTKKFLNASLEVLDGKTLVLCAALLLPVLIFFKLRYLTILPNSKTM